VESLTVDGLTCITLGLSRWAASNDLVRTGELFLCLGNVVDGRRVKLAGMYLSTTGGCSITLLLC